MTSSQRLVAPAARVGSFLGGVWMISLAMLTFQIVQSRILSVIAWYHLAFFAISVAMFGLTIGAVWIYLHPRRYEPADVPSAITRNALYFALSAPASVAVQLSLVLEMAPTVTTLVVWSMLLVAMVVPYVFAGVVLTLALTRVGYPVGRTYAVDLLGAAAGCILVIALLGVLNGPSVAIFAGALAAGAAALFAHWRGDGRPTLLVALLTAAVLALLAAGNSATNYGLRPIFEKGRFVHPYKTRFERWNSYSRIRAYTPTTGAPGMWGPSPQMPADLSVDQTLLNIDGDAGTVMYHFDGSRESIAHLQYDVVYLPYRLAGIEKSAVVGVGGAPDILAAHYFGVPDITGVELNEIFLDLHQNVEPYRSITNLHKLPQLTLHNDDARSWFASTDERFDLIQMSMIDTWAATGAGAFSLSENGLYTLEGWKAFLGALHDDGYFSVSRWYSPSNVNETGRMISLAAAVVLAMQPDANPADHIYVATSERVATLLLSRQALPAAQLARLEAARKELGFAVLAAPGMTSSSPVIAGILASRSIDAINASVAGYELDLTVTTDDRPFFFNQLKLSHFWPIMRKAAKRHAGKGVLQGNLTATATLLLILLLSLVGVVLTVLLPLRRAVVGASKPLVATATAYFCLIGTGFMLAEIGLLQYLGVLIGHPVYALGVCLFTLILAAGFGSLLSDRLPLDTRGKLLAWGGFLAVYLLVMSQLAHGLVQTFAVMPLLARLGVAVLAIAPAGLMMGFAFPTGMRLVGRVDERLTPWLWGINGAAGVLASVVAVFVSINFGIDVTLMLSAACYLLLIAVALALWRVTEAARV